MNSLRSTGLSSVKIIESSSRRALQTTTKWDASIRNVFSRFQIPSVRHPLESPGSIVQVTKKVQNHAYRNVSSLQSQPVRHTSTTCTSMLASNVARRFASRAPSRVCFSTAARSQTQRPSTPLMAAAGAVALSIALATREVCEDVKLQVMRGCDIGIVSHDSHSQDEATFCACDRRRRLRIAPWKTSQEPKSRS